MNTQTIVLSETELLRKKLILQCLNKEISTFQAAMQIGLSRRRIQQNLADYQKYGDKVFVHGNKNRKRHSDKEEERRKEIINIFLNTEVKGKNPFFNISYQFFSVLLKEHFGIKASPPYIKKILNSIGYISPIKHKTKKNNDAHLFRERKEHFGELIQADGKKIDLFNDGHQYCIQGFVDDATGYPVGLYVTKNECFLGYVEATRNMTTNFGIPQTLYPDRASVFFVNQPCKDGEIHLTQFGYIMENLGVDMFPAYCAEAKGRIERFWLTIQWRLPQLLALRGITTIEEVNEFLRNDFYRIYKNWFPKEPKSDESFFVKGDTSIINSLLKATFPGKVDKGGVFSFKGYRFLCKDLPGESICININEKEGMWVTKRSNPQKRYSVQVVETDTSGKMPEVFKDLIDRIFLKNAKPKGREVYIDIDDIVLSEIKPEVIRIA